MEVSAIRCNHCGDIVYSRTRHDMRFCSCGKVAIDGGQDYMKITGNRDDFEMYCLDLNVTKEQLAQDWNSQEDKLGLIPKFTFN